MKTNVAIHVIIAIILTACTQNIPTQEIVVTNSVPTATAVFFTELPMTQELTVTPEPTATKTPTKAPSETPFSCVTLLTPASGVEIAALGKVTFSWNAMNQATFYVLTIILPSGQSVSFDTKETSREQYMEAFSAGGQYQWSVMAQDRKRSEICSSELATFSKPGYDPPQQPRDDDRKRK